MDGDRRLFKFIDDPQKKDDELLTLRRKTHVFWGVCSDMKVPDGGIESRHFKMI
jgi:hypothetical protein